MMQFPTERGSGPQKPAAPPASRLLTCKEAAQFWRVSESFLAKARMTGDGPPFIKIGRSVRYSEATLLQWTRSQQRLSTSEK
jgi:predicted DNA-binding transcriptional regulator AlpA